MEEEEDVLKLLIQDSYEDDELNFEIDPDVEENLLKEPDHRVIKTTKDAENKPNVSDEKSRTQSESDQIKNVEKTKTVIIHKNKNFNQKNVPKRPFNDSYKDNSNRNAKRPNNRNNSNNHNPELFRVNANVALRLPSTKLIKDTLRFHPMPLPPPNLPLINPIGFYPDRYPAMNNMPMLNNNYPMPSYQQPRQLLPQPPLFPTFPPLNPFNPPPMPGMDFRDNLCQFSPSPNPMPFRPNPGPLFNPSFNSVADPYSYHQEMNNVPKIHTNLNNNNNHNFSNCEPNRDHTAFNKNAPLLPLPNAFNHPTIMNYPAPKMPTPSPTMLNNSPNSSTRMNINPRHSFRPVRQNLNVKQFNASAGNKPNLTVQQNPSSKPQQNPNNTNNPVNNQRIVQLKNQKPQQQLNKQPQSFNPRIFNNNLNNSSNIVKVKEAIEDKTLEIDEDYLKKLDEQKKLRAKIAQEKEQKRKILQLVCGNDPNTKDLVDDPKTQTINSRPVPPVNPIKKISEQSPIKQTVEKIGGSKKLSKEVILSGFTMDIRESVLRKLARPYGMVETIVISNDKRCAIIKFTQLNDAQKFMDQCEIDSVFEKNDEINAKITIAFHWFVSKFFFR